MKLTMEVIKDGNANALLYNRSTRLTGHQIFSKYVKFLFPLKQNEEVKGYCKPILTVLWGKLTQKKTQKIYHKPNSGITEIHATKEIVEVYPLNSSNTQYRIIIKEKNMTYETPYARIAPFLLAYGRRMMWLKFGKFAKTIKLIQTDAVYSTEALPIETGHDLGEIKYEGKCKDVKVDKATMSSRNYVWTI